ncbi:MAG: IMS domain-containing protein [Cyanobacteria bacterium]|nr:IMS domain-containing protein [Cyanobacteriota bacterium]
MGLDLPLDHFRLLGVSPATDAQTVLRTLQLRLDRAPEQGYTDETLRARTDLLRASADLLSDAERRSGYEADLTALSDAPEALMPALEIPSSREVAGLLLLLEAGQPLDVLTLASRCLQPPQAPALGSSREADLTLLAGEAALAAAEDYRRERHYEMAARTLQQGLQLLQRMGQLPELRDRIQTELEALAPFRVLDLLSRDPSASRERDEGLSLLEQLVQRRGGLEGSADDGFAPEDFQTFFKQIRTFLTVQEQIDLFDRWSNQGSGAADFLASIALTASGFAQRKPERIAAARERLLASRRDGVEPLLANLELLLGDVNGALKRFEGGASDELAAWAARQSGDPLGRLCAWCRDWLNRDVLPGYRDLDADPDLEAYFSDRDVMAWVEQEDRRRGRTFTPTPSTGPPIGLGGYGEASEPLMAPVQPGADFAVFGQPFEEADLHAQTSEEWPPYGHRPGRLTSERRQRRSRTNGLGGERDVAPGWGIKGLRHALATGAFSLMNPIAAIAGLGMALVVGSWLLQPRPLQPSSRITPPAPGTTPPPASRPPTPAPPQLTPTAPLPAAATPASKLPGAGSAAAPLTAREPDEAQMRALLESWLQAKTAVMAGGEPPASLERIAREGPRQRLETERQRDRTLGQVQDIKVRINSLTIQERSPQRIAVVADLDYSDSTRRGGREVNHTKATTLRNVYVFGRDGDAWRLAASGPAR